MSEMIGGNAAWEQSSSKIFRKKAAPNNAPEATADPNDTVAARRVELRSTETKKPSRGVGRKLGAAALVAVTAASATGVAIYKINSRNNKLNNFQTAENTLMNTYTHSPTTLSQNVLVIKKGVTYREQPFEMDVSHPDIHFGNHHLMPGNAAGRLATEQVIAKPLIYTDKGNTTWIGFRFQDGKVNTHEVSSDTVSDQMDWIDASKLTQQTAQIAPRHSSELLPFNVATLVAHTQEAKLDAHGQFLSDSGNPIAWAPPELTYAAAHRADMA